MSVHAIVTLTVEIHLASPWNKDCTFKEIEETAKKEAISKLNKINEHTKLVGNPHIKTIIVCEDK